MILNSLLVNDNSEISAHVLSSISIRLMNTIKNSRITESNHFMLIESGWMSLRNSSPASALQAHLLDYSLSKWFEAGGQEKNNCISDITKIVSNEMYLEDQRQTNSFQGKMWI